MASQSDKGVWWRTAWHFLIDVWEFLTRDIWNLDLSKLTSLEAFAIRQVKVLIFVIRQFFTDKLLIRASSLTYSTLLAIVPFLAVGFSISKNVGLHTNLAPALANFLSPLGPRGQIISDKILEFVQNAQTGALGLVGFVVLLLTVYGILSKIEGSYNDIWHAQRTKNWPRRLAGYILLIVFGPPSLFVILSLTASITSIGFVQEAISRQVFATLLKIALELMPYVLSCLLFAIVIWLVPNVRVSFRSALTGGIFSGLLWQALNWGFARFVAGATRASTRDVLFAGFAALPLFLLWLYISWAIMLLGAELGYVVQHVGVMEWRELEKQHGEALRRFVGVRATLEIVRNFVGGEGTSDLAELANRAGVPQPVLRDILAPLLPANILVRPETDSEHYLMARDPSQVTMAELLLALRGQGTLPDKLFSKDSFGKHVEKVLHEIDNSLAEGSARFSLLEATAAMKQRAT